MVNPFKIYRELKKSTIPIKDLELTSITDSNNWKDEDESKAAILALVKNPVVLQNDPVFFSQMVLGLFGIKPSFEDYEFLSSELTNSGLAVIKEIYNDLGTPLKRFGDDIAGYISVCCLEEGLFFLENELKEFQERLLTTSVLVNSHTIPDSDITKCEELWEATKDKKMESVKDTNYIEHQILINMINKHYTIFLSNPSVGISGQKPGRHNKN
jgi:hypothetical protein